MSTKACLLMALLNIELISVSTSSSAVTSSLALIEDSNEGDEILAACVTYRDMIREIFMSLSISYLSDNQRASDRAISAKDVIPFTPSQLFRHVYGAGASAVEFQKAISRFTYSSAPPAEQDRTQMRRDVAAYARAGSVAHAREVMSQLVLSVAGDYSKGLSAWSRHRCMPESAVDEAKTAIAVEFARLRNEVGEVKYGQILALGTGTTLTFVVDDTGSMSNEIEAAKRRAQLITDHLQNSIDRPQEYVLVPFNDPFVNDVTVTSDAGEFKEALSRLYADGGGDLPEMCLTGIQLAIEHSRAGSTIYVITDAQAKDYELQDTVVAQAIEKEISIVFMLTNQIRETCAKPASKKDRFHTCLSLYQYIAGKSGGNMVVMGKDDIFRATEIIETGLKQGLVVLKRKLLKVTNDMNPTTFYVDPTVSHVLVEASGHCGQLNLSIPNFNQVSGISKPQIVALDRVGELQSTSVPVGVRQAGSWHVLGRNSTNCNLKISGKTNFGFVLTVISKDFSQPHASYAVVNGLPSTNASVGFLIDVYGREVANQQWSRIERVRFVTPTGSDVITPVVIGQRHQSSVRVFLENGLRHTSSFYVTVEGRTPSGGRFARVASQLLSTSHVHITCDVTSVVFRRETPATVNISVRNNGVRNESFVIAVTDERGFASITGPSVKTIASGGSKTFRMSLTAPDDVKEGSASKITITARGSRPGSFQFHTCTVVVGQNKRPRVDSLQIKGIISARFAQTVVKSTVTNNDPTTAREAEFDVTLPADAFIMNLTMKTQNETIIGKVDEKFRAKKIYDKAKKQQKTAGHVAVRDKSTRVYRTSLQVAPHETVVFELTYQQLLRRVRGEYEYTIVLSPGQPVKRLLVDLRISDEDRLQFVRVPALRTDQTNLVDGDNDDDDPPEGTSLTFSDDRRVCSVLYRPTLDQQTQHSPLGMSGSFVVRYDVQRTQIFGTTTVQNGYFAHFFSAPFVDPMPKLVVFVVDSSASMFGHKWEQLKQALRRVLTSLNGKDYFNVVTFGDSVRPWLRSIMSPAAPESVDSALEFLDSYKPQGGTNIEAAFLETFDQFQPYLPDYEEDPNEPDDISKRSAEDDIRDIMEERSSNIRNIRKRAVEWKGRLAGHAKIVVFLTDGRPTVGATNTKQILDAVKSANRDRVVIHTVGFGPLVEMGFLTKLAASNRGISRRVFESLDAAAQIGNFFDEVINPVMSDVTIEFDPGKVDDVTGDRVTTLFRGGEMVVAGRIRRSRGDHVTAASRVNELGEVDDSFPNATGGELSLDGAGDPFVIHGQVRGRSVKNQVILDFDIQPSADPRRNSVNKQQTRNFTERLWSFLRIKQLLRQAKLSDNETEQDFFNEQALNMSLRYNFVTPLTSLVVIRPDDRKAIEEEVDSELETERKKEEDKLILEEEMKSKSRVREKELLRKTSKASDVVYDDYSSYGLYGDPHFIIPLVSSQTHLCFNWDGEDGKVYNLIHNPVTGATVNVRLTTGRNKRTYVSTIAFFVAGKSDFQLIIRPDDVTIRRTAVDDFNLPASTPFHVNNDEVTMRLYDVTSTTATLRVVSDQLCFLVALSRRQTGIPPHADLSLCGDHSKMEGSEGVLGQFFSSNLKIRLIDQMRADLLFNGLVVGRVNRHMRRDPVSHKPIQCWQAHKGFVRDHLKSSVRDDNFLLPDLFRSPNSQLMA